MIFTFTYYIDITHNPIKNKVTSITYITFETGQQLFNQPRHFPNSTQISQTKCTDEFLEINKKYTHMRVFAVYKLISINTIKEGGAYIIKSINEYLEMVKKNQVNLVVFPSNHSDRSLKFEKDKELYGANFKIVYYSFFKDLISQGYNKSLELNEIYNEAKDTSKIPLNRCYVYISPNVIDREKWMGVCKELGAARVEMNDARLAKFYDFAITSSIDLLLGKFDDLVIPTISTSYLDDLNKKYKLQTPSFQSIILLENYHIELDNGFNYSNTITGGPITILFSTGIQYTSYKNLLVKMGFVLYDGRVHSIQDIKYIFVDSSIQHSDFMFHILSNNLSVKVYEFKPTVETIIQNQMFNDDIGILPTEFEKSMFKYSRLMTRGRFDQSQKDVIAWCREGERGLMDKYYSVTCQYIVSTKDHVEGNYHKFIYEVYSYHNVPILDISFLDDCKKENKFVRIQDSHRLQVAPPPPPPQPTFIDTVVGSRKRKTIGSDTD
ncbi:hypothetical protein ACTFIR_007843 [Dictyostelium discoideum]